MEFIETKKNWIQVELRQVCDFIGGSQPSKKDFIYEHKLGYIRLIQIRDYKSNDYLTFIPLSKAKRLCSKDDVMIGRYGPPLFQILRGLEGAYNVALIKAKPINNQLLDNNFLCYFLKTNEIRSFIIQSSERTVGQDGVRKDLLEQYPIPLPPLNEQHRIVAKLEQLLSKVQSCQERLDRIPKILKRFRQSVLAAACSGRLTEDWREQNPDVEPAIELLKRIRVSVRKGNQIVNADEAPFEIPSTWEYSRIGQLTNNIKYGTSQKCGYEKDTIPVLRIPNIGSGIIDFSDLKYTDLSDREYEELKLKKGDILLIRSNGSVSLVGKTAIVGRKEEEGFAYAGYLIRLRFDSQNFNPFYINYILSSYYIRLQIEMPARSTSGVNNINSNEVRNLTIPLPPLAEQQEIVQRVESLFHLADQVEQKYNKAKAYVDHLTQSILAKAFRGELVPQDTNDEPAEALLERIRNEKDSQDKAAGKKRSRKLEG